MRVPWLIIGTVVGALVVFIAGAPVIGHGWQLESQLQSQLRLVLGGSFAGILVGMAIDIREQFRKRPP